MTAKHDKKNFAKLFEFDDLGQVLLTLQIGDDGPEITYRIAGMLGVEPSVTFSGYSDNEDGWAKAEKYFEILTEPDAKLLGKKLEADVLEMLGDSNG